MPTVPEDTLSKDRLIRIKYSECTTSLLRDSWAVAMGAA